MSAGSARRSRTGSPRRQPEKAIQRTIVRNLRMLGFFVNDLTQPRRTMMPPGLPDVLCWHSRWQVVLWIEVKAGKNKPSTDQLVWHREARAAGMNVLVAWSWEDVFNELKRLGVPLT